MATVCGVAECNIYRVYFCNGVCLIDISLSYYIRGSDINKW